MTKTVMIWDSFGQDDLKFYVFDSDLSRFDKVFINSGDCDDSLCDDLLSLMYRDDGYIIDGGMIDFPLAYVASGDAKVIVCGFIP